MFGIDEFSAVINPPQVTPLCSFHTETGHSTFSCPLDEISSAHRPTTAFSFHTDDSPSVYHKSTEDLLGGVRTQGRRLETLEGTGGEWVYHSMDQIWTHEELSLFTITL